MIQPLLFSPSGVANSRELQRVAALPRRTWGEEETRALVETMTRALRRPEGTQKLLPIQAIALFEIWRDRSAFIPAGVGSGKTLISFLAPYVLGSRRPLLILPAKLIPKTKTEMREYARHWPIPNFIRLVSCEITSTIGAKRVLEEYRPDLIVIDECHKYKNHRAARTRRLTRYLEANPTRVVLETGTLSKNSILDYAHFLKWALHECSPVPITRGELEEWAEALDEKDTDRTRPIGYLRTFMNDTEREEEDEQIAARMAFRRRLVETSGVVATSANVVGASLTVEAKEHEVSRQVDEAFDLLVGQQKLWLRPDGVQLEDPLSVRRHGRTLSLGFWERWDPEPPEEWMSRRKDWTAWCRYILVNNRRDLDSELEVANAIDAGHYPDAVQALERWREVRASFKPNPVPVWLDEHALEFCVAWARESPGIVWCEHVAFAKRLAKLAKLTYYGAGSGEGAMLHDPRQSFVASINSVSDGLNLQKWHRNLITSFPPNAIQTEQTLGRTHRQGQEADEVTFEVLGNSAFQLSGFWRSLRQAHAIEQREGQRHKILYADKIMPDEDEVVTRPQARWQTR